MILCLNTLGRLLLLRDLEDLRNALHKEIDLLNTNQLKNNLELTEEILKDGIRIYG